MLKRMNIFRTAVLCIALCAAPMSIRAEDNLADLLAAIKGKQAELKELVTRGIGEEQLKVYYNQLGEYIVKLFKFRSSSIFGEATEDEVNAIKSVIESIDIEQFKLIAEAVSPVDMGKTKKALDTLQDFIGKCKYDINAYYAQIARQAARDKFIADLSSWKSYTAAWDALCTTEGLQEKATELWSNHKPAVAGAAIVVATAAVITACVVYRNKIKAGLNRLFGSTAKTENNNDTQE